jgi:uncharacterized protein DUF3313
MYRVVLLTTIGAVCISAAAFAAAKEAPAPSGFLGDYSQLEQHPEKPKDDARFYAKPGLDFGDYNAVLIQSPLVYLKPDAKAQGIDPKELAELSEYLHDKLVGAVEDDFELVDEPGPGVVVLRVAITDVEPIKAVAGAVGKLALKVVNVDLGGAAIEAELVDGETGERLMAVIDSERGNRFGVGMAGGKTWGHTKNAFKEWSKRLPIVLGGEAFDGKYGAMTKKQ